MVCIGDGGTAHCPGHAPVSEGMCDVYAPHSPTEQTALVTDLQLPKGCVSGPYAMVHVGQVTLCGTGKVTSQQHMAELYCLKIKQNKLNSTPGLNSAGAAQRLQRSLPSHSYVRRHANVFRKKLTVLPLNITPHGRSIWYTFIYI